MIYLDKISFHVAQILIIISGLWLSAGGIIMFVKPLSAKAIIGKAGSTNLINCTELGLRGIWAIAMLYSAHLSKFPEFFKLFGIMLSVTTVILLLIPRKLHARFSVWSSSKLPITMLRICAPMAVSF